MENLLLNIPLPGHGEPDRDEIAFLNELIDWQRINSEAIQGSRPWTIFGEGPSTHAPKMGAYQMNRLRYDSSDVRFTTKGDTLYAIALGWPADGKFLITSLADGSANYPRQIGKVELLGAQSNLKWSRGPKGLEIQAPDAPPCKYAYTFRILSA